MGRTKTAKPADSEAAVAMAFSSCQNYPVGFFNGHKEAAHAGSARPLPVPRRLPVRAGAGSGARKHGARDRGPEVLPRPLPALPRRPGACASCTARNRSSTSGTTTRSPTTTRRTTLDRATCSGPRATACPSSGCRGCSSPAEQFRIYNRFQHGRTADVILLDQRQYRTGDNDGQPRSLLGRPQMDYLKARLKASPSTWKLVGNQVMIAPLQAGAAGAGRRSTPTSGTATTPSATSCSITSPPRASRTSSSSPATSTPTWPTRCRSDAGPVYTPVASEYIGGSVTSGGLPHAGGGGQRRQPVDQELRRRRARLRAVDRDGRTRRPSPTGCPTSSTEGAESRTLSRWRQPAGSNTPVQEAGARRSFRSGPEPTRRRPTSERAPNEALRRRRSRWERYVERDQERLGPMIRLAVVLSLLLPGAAWPRRPPTTRPAARSTSRPTAPTTCRRARRPTSVRR